jgi:hypothetical protein
VCVSVPSWGESGVGNVSLQGLSDRNTKIPGKVVISLLRKSRLARTNSVSPDRVDRASQFRSDKSGTCRETEGGSFSVRAKPSRPIESIGRPGFVRASSCRLGLVLTDIPTRSDESHLARSSRSGETRFVRANTGFLP